jgi:selenocysteine lyase/cysteine desulfurase
MIQAQERQVMQKLDSDWVRRQFPSLKQTVNGHPAVFFDGPAGTQVPQQVIDAISDYLLHSNANNCGAFATSTGRGDRRGSPRHG